MPDAEAEETTLENAALTQALRRVALTNGDWAVNFEACATYKIIGGTAALAAAMPEDSKATIAYGFTVEGITDNRGSVDVRSRDGRAVQAKAVIVTVPLHAMDAVSFKPHLPAVKAEGAKLGQAAKGTKFGVGFGASMHRSSPWVARTGR